MRSNPTRHHGFTLVEVLVATTITSFIALVAVGTLQAVSASAQKLDENILDSAEIRFAAAMLQRDLINLYRDEDTDNTQFTAMGGDIEEGANSYLLCYTISRTRARPGQPEGEVYEVEYYVEQQDEQSVLMRRLWPNPDKEIIEPGGILMAVAEDIAAFQMRFFDGEEWSTEWPEEMQALPDLVEVSLVSSRTSAGSPAVESFLINYARNAGSGISESGQQTDEGSAASSLAGGD